MDRELQAGFPGNALILAVQAVIAANDAFTIRNLGERCASDRHEDAEAVFARVKAVPGTKEARGHLVKLLKAKGSIEYSGKPVDREKAQRLSEHARRFVEFVRKNLK
ncbi:MAG TPA: hypothetical protein VK661_10630 [Planctomycetota bacterium]|nr:hypothetical protein [Planctomycetota bacterium]